MRSDNLVWFVNTMETGTIKLRASKRIPKPSKQGSDSALPKTKVGKRFAAQDILQKDDEMNGQQSPTETYSTWVLTIPILYQSCLLM